MITPLINNTTVPNNPNVAFNNSWITVANDQNIPLFAQLAYNVNTNSSGSEYVEFGKRNKSVIGAAKVALSQNVYEADFEYGTQPLRWEIFTSSLYNTATVQHVPGAGAVKMTILSGGDVTIRQSRPYHRYQPGKSMYMATATNYGGPYNGQYQRVGFFDDANGMFFEQGSLGSTYTNNYYVSANAIYSKGFPTEAFASSLGTKLSAISSSFVPMSSFAAFGSTNISTVSANAHYYQGINRALSANNPYGMYVCWRSDINPYAITGVATSATYVDYKLSLDQWSDPSGIRYNIDWTKNQMLWLEYSWYGSGCLRWGILLGGEPYILHEQTMGNLQQYAWARTGNLPVRYEQRDTTFTNTSAVFLHYGVSVLVEGQRDPQRGFTYAYGNDNTIAIAGGKKRIPILSFRPRTMGTIEFTNSSPGGAITSANSTSVTMSNPAWGINQWVNRAIYFPTLTSTANPNGVNARILSNTGNTLTVGDIITLSALSSTYIPTANTPYQIGLIDRGQLLPQSLIITSNATALVELIASTPTNPVTLYGPTAFTPLSSLGSSYSFAERDTTSTSVSGGEVVYGFLSPGTSNVQELDLSNFFGLYNNIRGNTPDILTVAVTTTTNAPVSAGVHVVCQEAMS